MRLRLFFLALLFSCVAAYGQPKAVKAAFPSVASVVTYKDGLLKADGTALFVGGNGNVIASGKLFVGADSAVVIGNNGKARPVRNIVGINNMFDCVKVRTARDKKIKYLVSSASEVYVGDELYMLTYGVKKSVIVESFKVLAVDSVYSLAYYTLDKPVRGNSLAQPLLNSNGELVAFAQPSLSGDTVSFAVSSQLASSLISSTRNYGKGYYQGMNIRTAMPDVQGEALSCLYMQAMMGDSTSWCNAINDYIASFPQSYEGYQSLAEFVAIYSRDMEKADKAWDKALSLTDNKAEVYFGKGKVINEIVQSGDTLSHAMLTFGNALELVDKAISINNSSMYISYKADMLYGIKNYEKAAECYESLTATDMRSPELFAKASQCYIVMQQYDKGVEMLDSAVACFSDDSKGVAPYLLTRGVVKSSAKRYREAVQDMNRYEELVGGMLAAEFYYMREQAELNCKMYQQALNDIETALALDSDNLLYYLEKGMLCYRVKFTDEGIRTMLKACELAPELADAHYLLGRLYMQQGNVPEARKSLETADKLGHSDARVQLDGIE